MSTWRNAAYLIGNNPTDVNSWDKYYNMDKINSDFQPIASNWTIDSLNALNDSNFKNLTWDKTVNSKGYAGWNEAFNNLGLNKFFGYSDAKDDFMGPSTWNRKQFLDNLKTVYNSKDNLLTISNGQKTFYNPTTNSWELYSDQSNPTPQPATEPVQANPVAETPTDQNTKMQPLKFDPKPQEEKKERWAGWIPHTVNLLSDLSTINRNRELSKQINPVLHSAPKRNIRVTDNFAEQQMMNNEAAKLESLGNQGLTSNADYNLAQKLAYHSKASDIRTKAGISKAQNDQAEIRRGDDISWENTQLDSNKSNLNRDRIGAVEQYRIQSEIEANTRKNAARQNFTTGMWNDLTKFNQIQDINKAHTKDRQFKSDNISQQHDLIRQYQQEFNDFTTSDEYNQWKNFVNSKENQGLWESIPTEQSEFDTWIKNGWTSDPNAKIFREQWEKRRSARENEINQQLETLRLQMSLGADQPLYFTGQPQLNIPDLRRTSPAFKKGGKIDRLSDYLKIIQQENDSFRKNAESSRKSNLQKLEKELERINQKQILLLKEIFG